MSSTVRFVATTGVAWIMSLALTIGVLTGIHRALSRDTAVATSGHTQTPALIASAHHRPPRLANESY